MTATDCTCGPQRTLFRPNAATATHASDADAALGFPQVPDPACGRLAVAPFPLTASSFMQHWQTVLAYLSLLARQFASITLAKEKGCEKYFEGIALVKKSEAEDDASKHSDNDSEVDIECPMFDVNGNFADNATPTPANPDEDDDGGDGDALVPKHKPFKRCLCPHPTCFACVANLRTSSAITPQANTTHALAAR
jgi:hypothetical protein